MGGVFLWHGRSLRQTAPTALHLTEWADDSSDFGGMSGLQLLDGGKTLIAVSDEGTLVQAHIHRTPDGQIASVETNVITRFLDNFGKPVTGFEADSEALRLAPDGGYLVGFEGYARIAEFQPGNMMPTPLSAWDRFKSIWGNSGFESLAVAPDGQIIAILEDPAGSPSAYQTMLYHGGKVWKAGPSLPTDGNFKSTDADFGPDGQLYVLERQLTLTLSFITRISVYQSTPNGFSKPKTVLLTEAGAYGDFEGLDVWRNKAGRLTATMINDNNFMPFVPTTVAEFALER